MPNPRELGARKTFYCSVHNKTFKGYESYIEHGYGRRFHSQGRGYMNRAYKCKCCHGLSLHNSKCQNCNVQVIDDPYPRLYSEWENSFKEYKL